MFGSPWFFFRPECVSNLFLLFAISSICHHFLYACLTRLGLLGKLLLSVCPDFKALQYLYMVFWLWIWIGESDVFCCTNAAVIADCNSFVVMPCLVPASDYLWYVDWEDSEEINKKIKNNFESSFQNAWPTSFETLLQTTQCDKRLLLFQRKSLMLLQKILVIPFQCMPEQIPWK